jgi:hypothetical protein
MLDCRHFRAIPFICLVLFLAGCGTKGLNSVQVTPATQSLIVGQTAQFTAVGTYGNASRPSSQNITNTVTWSSSIPAVATVSASGVATAVSAGTTMITANATAFNGPVSSSATLVVTGAGQGAVGGGVLLSLTILPTSISVGNLQDSGQFLAIGTFSSAPTVRDLTNSPTLKWISDVPSVFPVNTNSAGNIGATAGIVTAYGNGSAVITAETTGSDGSIQTASASFNCPLVLPNPPTTPGSCYPGSQAPALLATLTIYNEGLNNTNWLVTASSATGTPNVLNCGPASSASVCSASYPFTDPSGNPTAVVLKATGGNFGGWSYNCAPSDASGKPLPAGQPQFTAAGPNYCVFTFNPSPPTYNTNVTVGAIFN